MQDVILAYRGPITESLISLLQVLDVRYTILEGEFAGSPCMAGIHVKRNNYFGIYDVVRFDTF